MSHVWTCAACATANEPTESSCVVCHIPRPVAPPPASPPPADPTRVPVASTTWTPAAAGPPSPGGAPAGQGGVPLVTATAAPEPPASTPRRGGVPVAALVAVVILIAAVAGVVFLTSGGGDDGSDVSADLDDGNAYVDDAGSVDSSTVDDTTSEYDDYGEGDEEYNLDEETGTTLETTTVPAETTRSARLFAGDAKLRSAPSLTASDVARFTGRDGAALEVIGEPTPEGWYHVRIDGQEGYLFGVFVLPPAPGFCVATSVDGVPPVWDDHGEPIPDEKSGNKVLITSSVPDSGGWSVVLPGGRSGHVLAGDLTQPVCG
ncbi:MAG: hypothetical protein JWO77_2209 [Ilumatobacteraceae bacterium]|nr:hypothetical protein [Ilumatobacteraceae bacterium]